jgi:hypothetical protein
MMQLERRTGEELADRRQRGRHALAPGGRRRCRGHWVHAGEGVCNGGCRRRVGCVRADVCAAGRIRQPGYAGPARAAARLYTPAGGPRAISASVAQMGARDETIAAGAPPATDPRGPARARSPCRPPAKRAQGTARIMPQRTAELHAGRRPAYEWSAHTLCAHASSYARADRPCRRGMTSGCQHRGSAVAGRDECTRGPARVTHPWRRREGSPRRGRLTFTRGQREGHGAGPQCPRRRTPRRPGEVDAEAHGSEARPQRVCQRAPAAPGGTLFPTTHAPQIWLPSPVFAR